ncbi:MAG: MerR family transcriptional regulator [Gemmatimonadales bacterium]
MTGAPMHPSDPLAVLRGYRTLAPWGLPDLASLAGTILEGAAIVPLSGTARARPTERGIRFYVTRGLVNPPEGRGSAAIYGYRHLLQVLGIKLRQMEGVSLEEIILEARSQTGDAVERRVAASLGAALPPPDLLEWREGARGRAARFSAPSSSARNRRPETLPANCRRVLVVPGVELLLDPSHPALRTPGAEVALVDTLRNALAAVDAARTSA